MCYSIIITSLIFILRSTKNIFNFGCITSEIIKCKDIVFKDKQYIFFKFVCTTHVAVYECSFLEILQLVHAAATI